MLVIFSSFEACGWLGYSVYREIVFITGHQFDSGGRRGGGLYTAQTVTPVGKERCLVKSVIKLLPIIQFADIIICYKLDIMIYVRYNIFIYIYHGGATTRGRIWPINKLARSDST